MARAGMMGPLMLGAGLGMLAQNQRRPYAWGPPNVGAGLGQGLQTGLALYGAMNQPVKPRESRTVNLPGGYQQLQEFNPSTQRWEPQGDKTRRWQPKEKPQRRIVKGADGFNYYADTGERVLPKVAKPPGKVGSTNVHIPGVGLRLATVQPDGTLTYQGKPLPEGSYKAGVVGTPEEVSPTPTTAAQRGQGWVNMQEREAGTEQALRQAAELRDHVAANPHVLGVPGALTGWLGGMTAQAKQLIALKGQDLDEGLTANFDRYLAGENVGLIEELGAASDEFRAMAFPLAMMAAAARGDVGRSVTEADVKRYMREIGADMKQGVSFDRTIDRFMRNMDADFQGRRNIYNRDNPKTPYPEVDWSRYFPQISPDIPAHQMTDEQLDREIRRIQQEMGQ